MAFFVKQGSIVRDIWGKADTILFIFAGASAEFALNKAVDWLYFTGKLPSDPLGRLFSTVAYARQIVFSELEQANSSIDKIAAIHKGVESQRGASIPDWAYRDVLFMLIDYSIRSYEVLERKLSDEEKEEVHNVFYRVGERMHLKELPLTYKEWQPVRVSHMHQNLVSSNFTSDLFKQYKKHLGPVRYRILVESQKIVVPEKVNQLLEFKNSGTLKPVLDLYKLSKKVKLDNVLKHLILPQKYLKEIKSLDVTAN